MTDERQAVKTLAENLVKAMKSVSANTPSKVALGGTTPGTIQASKIVGLPAAFSSIINGVESSAAAGDAVAQQTLSALNHIAAGEFETITADTAMIEKVYATFGDFITLVAEDAQIGDLDVETIRAGLADIGLLNIGSASIDMAQIKRSSTQTAFIHESVQGKVYIDDLAVNDASIVNLAAGTVLINDPNGDLVELYVDAQGNVSTRAVAYDGSDIINQNSLNGNRIVQNSITADRLNASEIFASQGTIMNLITDNIEATRLFANQGFIPQLETTILSSAAIAEGLDLSTNSTITLLQDSINLLSTNANRTFIQDTMPMPAHPYDTWFNPQTEEHYIANGAALPIQNLKFGVDENVVLYNDRAPDYQFTINSDGELMILVTNDVAAQSIVENDIDFNIVEDKIHISVGEGELWNKIDNVAFSNLKISVDGVTSDVNQILYDVYDPVTGESKIVQNASRIDQNADNIALTVQSVEKIEGGTTAVPYVETSSIKIKDDKVEIKSTGDVDIKASNFSISFNTAGALTNKSRVDISNDVGIKVSDSYGNYFQATSTKIGLYDIQNNPKLYMDNSGHAFFNGSLTLGGANNVNGSLSVKNASGNTIVLADNSGLSVYNSQGTTRQFYIDSSTGNATFAGSLSAATGTFAGSLSAATGTFAGTMSAACITSGTMSAARISGGTLTLGGANNGNGQLAVNKANGSKVVELNNSGITIYNGEAKQFYVDSSGNAKFAGDINIHSVDNFWINDYTMNSEGFVLHSKYENGAIKFSEKILMEDGNIDMEYYNSDNELLKETYLNSGSVQLASLQTQSGYYIDNPFIRLYGASLFDLNKSNVPVYETVICADHIRVLRDNELLLTLSGNKDILSDFSASSVSMSYNLSVQGTKSRLVSTDQYSSRLLYCYETPSPLFGDVGEGVISSDGLCYISLDPIFAQTISTDQYQVFLQTYGEGNCYVSERHGSYFVVSGTPNLSFGWELKAKQSDFDQLRLERNDEKFSVPSQTYGEDAANHIKELYKERTEQESEEK